MASTANGGGGSSVPKRKPVFVKVDHLKPGTNGHTLTVKVVSANAVSQQKKSRNNSQLLGKGGGGQARIAECLIGDETGTILFTARNEQGPLSFSIHMHAYVYVYTHIHILLSLSVKVVPYYLANNLVRNEGKQ